MHIINAYEHNYQYSILISLYCNNSANKKENEHGKNYLTAKMIT